MLQLARRTEPTLDALDRAWSDLADYGPDLANGFTNHAPMVAEALDALGRAEAIAPWIDRYRPTMLPWPEPVAPAGGARRFTPGDRLARVLPRRAGGRRLA